MISTLLSQSRQYSRYLYQEKVFGFYSYFFEKSALYHSFKQHTHRQSTF
jgi:hypothetical protein